MIATLTLGCQLTGGPAPPMLPSPLGELTVTGPLDVSDVLAPWAEAGEADLEAIAAALINRYRDEGWRVTEYRESRRAEGGWVLSIQGEPPIDMVPPTDGVAADDVSDGLAESPVPEPRDLAGGRRETDLDDRFSDWLQGDARVLVDTAGRRLYLRQEDGEIVSYAVAVGTPRTPTPARDYVVEQISKHPTWYPPASIRRDYAARGTPLPDRVPPGRGNPLGLYYVRLQNSIGIHGTNQPSTIGSAASYGCIRMHDQDVAVLASQLSIGDRVVVVRRLPAPPPGETSAKGDS